MEHPKAPARDSLLRRRETFAGERRPIGDRDMTDKSILSYGNNYETVPALSWPFGRFFEDALTRRNDDAGRLLAPALDITEDEHSYTVSTELPGLKKEDVKIQFENGVLTISGEKRVEEETEGKDRSWHRMERRYGSFLRTVALPNTVAVDNADAKFEDGVLTIKLPKREDVKPKTLKIK
jgi:HSP20 family protein